MGVFSAFTDQIISQNSAAGWRAALGLGAVYQPIDATLTALAGLDASAGLIYQSGADAFAKTPLLNWAAYTPTITAGAGTFTTVSATGRWAQINKVVLFGMQIGITANGTASGFIKATLPVNPVNAYYSIYGREVAVFGFMIQGLLAAGVNFASLYTYNNAYPGGSGASIIVNGFYEVA